MAAFFLHFLTQVFSCFSVWHCISDFLTFFLPPGICQWADCPYFLPQPFLLPYASVSPRAEFYHQLPAAILSRRGRKITKPPIQGRALVNQLGNFGRALINPPRQLWMLPYQSARQVWVRPYQSVRQQATTSTLPMDFHPPPPHIAWGSLSLFVCTADPPSPPLRPRPAETHIPLLPF